MTTFSFGIFKVRHSARTTKRALQFVLAAKLRCLKLVFLLSRTPIQSCKVGWLTLHILSKKALKVLAGENNDTREKPVGFLHTSSVQYAHCVKWITYSGGWTIPPQISWNPWKVCRSCCCTGLSNVLIVFCGLVASPHFLTVHMRLPGWKFLILIPDIKGTFPLVTRARRANRRCSHLWQAMQLHLAELFHPISATSLVLPSFAGRNHSRTHATKLEQWLEHCWLWEPKFTNSTSPLNGLLQEYTFALTSWPAKFAYFQT